MMCVEFRSALMQAVLTYDKTFRDGGYACRIFWGWLDACVRIVLKIKGCEQKGWIDGSK